MSVTLRHPVERHPLLWTALLAVAAVAVADGHVVVGAGMGVVILAILLHVRRTDVLFTAVACAALAGGLHASRVIPQREAQRMVQAADGVLANVTARVATQPKGTGGGWSALVEIESGGPAGKVWWLGFGPAPGKGALIGARGRFLPFPVRRNPGEFDMAGWLFRQGAWGRFEANGLARTLEPPSWQEQAAARAQAWFRDAVTAGLDPLGQDAAVIRAMVLGEMPQDEDVLIEAYRASGTLHVFSVSGMHVAMVGVIVWWVLKMCRVSRRPAIFVIILAMIGYVWITGAKPPSVRSLVMAGVVLGAFLLRLRPDLLNALGLALVAALIGDGHLIFQVGVQLSFGVVAAIGIAAGLLRKHFEWMETREPYLPRQLYGFWRTVWLRIRQKSASAMGASSAASFGSLPLTFWHFGFASWVSILASPLIGIPVFVLMALALAATALAPFPAVREQVNRINGRVATVCTKMATAFAAIPAGSTTIARGRPGENFLVIYDTGHGGGSACLHDGGTSVLFDTAHRAGFRRTVLPSLRYMALRPQSVVLSHPDAGHLGGTAEAFDALPIRQVLMPVERARSPVFREIEALSQDRGVVTTVGLPQVHYPVSSDAWFEVIHRPDAHNQNVLADERVMVTRLHWRGWRVLFTSDAGLATERAMLRAGGDLQADVIVAGRHSQDDSLGDDFLAAVQPRAIVAGHADFPEAQRVPEDWMAACESRGIRVFHQGHTGAVTLVAEEDGSLVIRGFLDGAELRLRR
ncbi:ComEC/Rec2 family competence protein [Luteolibacter flavescens]|uniref:ComEC/Rec2 family competence protein n=1 Tax=Luteolibacter flavescens TaxID=1859460 RepID=A0ABT3FJW5_9BACT|nr:ComEC/Rec2 family competence protein [Luteolibacter flavescens]MCW1883868.1 ComEC/Rec2 family competence protein [Luteolibacter flavescens]